MPKILGALGATVWHFLCVYPLMPMQTRLDFEALATQFAYERCLTCVNFFMRLKFYCVGKVLKTFQTPKFACCVLSLHDHQIKAGSEQKVLMCTKQGVVVT